MVSPWYNRSPIVSHTQATAEQLNSEFTKIAAAFDQLPEPGAVGTGAGTPVYTHFAYADSADGSANFTTGAPANRSYVGIQVGVANAVASEFPEDYDWTKLKGADGADGADGQYYETRWIRSWARPTAAVGISPGGTSTEIPSGTERLWFTTALKDSDGTPAGPWSQWQSVSGFLVRGAYNSTTAYYLDDGVTYNGGTYRALGNTTGNAPSGTAETNAYWDVIAAPGSQGEPATPPSAFSATINLASSSVGANLRTLADAAGYTGMSDATVDFVVPAGVTVTGNGNGGRGIDTGNWPTSSYTITLTLTVQNTGKAYGGGGAGGDGGSYGAGGVTGGQAGDAVYCQAPISVTIDAGGEVKGGGGGGNGGASGIGGSWAEPTYYGGGGGGGGAPNGAAGAAGLGDTDGVAGSAGTVAGGGGGGASGGPSASPGASGGDFATAGGGAAGYAVRKNGFTVPITNNGTMTGSAA